MVEIAPPIPPSATYRFPSGPNFSPRGLFNPPAKWCTFADGPCAHASIPPPSKTPTPNANDNPRTFAELVLMDLSSQSSRNLPAARVPPGFADTQQWPRGQGAAMHSHSYLCQFSLNR